MHDVAKPQTAPSSVKSNRKIFWSAIGGVVALVVVLVSIKASQIGTMISAGKKMVPPPEAVTSAVVTEEDWAPVLSSVGSISAIQGAIVSTELGGTVAEIGFQNGAPAKKGDVLIKLDASQEEALLRSSEAEVELSRADLERTRGLEGKKVVSKAELDAAESKFRRLTAVVDQMQSNIRKKTVVAPFDGQLGIRQVNVGQMINSGQPVVPLELLESVFVDFALPQQHLSKLSPGLKVRVRSDAAGGKEFEGKLTAINPGVDTATRNVSVQATLENSDHALRPGMFAKVEVDLPEKHKALVIPGTAVSYAPYGDSVFVIEKKKDPKTGKESQTIRAQFVRVGEARGDFVSITSGLKAGETIVGAGVFKLRNGQVVAIKNDLAPKPQINPTPTDS
jgi:membrane fusion protein (multidrug efflux system)